jgi:D-alanyl-D-alanine carboxypeptidase
LVSEASWDGRTLLAVVLGAKATKSGNTETIGSFTESASLLSWGFANYDTALQYQSYLATLPQETPEPSEEPTPEEAPEETPEPSEEPTPSPEPTSSPSPSPTVTPEPTAETSPAPTQAAVTLLGGIAETFGISPQVLLLGAAGLSALGLLLFLLLLVHMLRTRKE